MTPEELQAKIDDYFTSISYLTQAMRKRIGGYSNGKGKAMYFMQEAYDEQNRPVMELQWSRPPTLSGLCLHVGITRQEFQAYQAKPEYERVCLMARLRIEAYLEEELCAREKVGGLIKDLEKRHGWLTPDDDSKPKEQTMSMQERIAFLREQALEIINTKEQDE
jgi:hypothetical protein